MATKKESTKKPDNGDGSTPEPVLASPEVPAVIPPTAPMGVFDSDPVAAIEQARMIVQHVNTLIAPRRGEFIAHIQGKEYPMVDWWTAVGQPLGLSPQVVWVKRREDFEQETWEARVEVYNRGGQMISSGQAICSRQEKNKSFWDTYALYSMAQTRAMGKAYRLPLSFMAVLAGLEPVPAEEMGSQPEDPAVNLDALPDEIAEPLKELGYTRGKARAVLAQFLRHDGTLNEIAAAKFLSAQIDQRIENGGE